MALYVWRWQEKIEVESTGSQKLKRKNPWQLEKHAKLYSDLLPPSKREPSMALDSEQMGPYALHLWYPTLCTQLYKLCYRSLYCRPDKFCTSLLRVKCWRQTCPNIKDHRVKGHDILPKNTWPETMLLVYQDQHTDEWVIYLLFQLHRFWGFEEVSKLVDCLL